MNIKKKTGKKDIWFSFYFNIFFFFYFFIGLIHIDLHIFARVEFNLKKIFCFFFYSSKKMLELEK